MGAVRADVFKGPGDARDARDARDALVCGYASMLGGGTGLLLLTAWESMDAFDAGPILGEAVRVTGLLPMAAGGWLQLLSARARASA